MDSCVLGVKAAAGGALFERLSTLESTGRDVVSQLGLLERSGSSLGLGTSTPALGRGSSLIGLLQRVANLERDTETRTGPSGDLPSLFSRHTLSPDGAFTPGLGGVVPSTPSVDDIWVSTL